MSVNPTPEELGNIALCAQKLWDLDADKLEPDVDYGIHIQGGTRPYWTSDNAEGKLFLGVSKSVWERPAYRSFYVLLDNYVK